MNPSPSLSSLASAEKAPVLFNDFFELGLEETASPFLTPSSRRWAAHLTIKASIAAAFFLLASFLLQFSASTVPLSHLFLILVYFLAGIPALIESLEDLACLELNIDILMTLAAFSSILIGNGMEGGLLLVLFALSGALEDAVTNKAKGTLSSLHKLSPTKACVIDSNGIILEKSLKDVAVGSSILVRAGEIVPLDGKVTAGVSSVNLVHLTGENMPVTKIVGDSVPAGGRNLEGVLTLTVERTSHESTLGRIIQLVTAAQEAKPKLQRWFDKLSNAYAMTIISLAALFALTLPFILNIPFLGVEGGVYRALAFLIAASPCALIIAIPIAYLSALSVSARQGILLKGGITLDAIARCKVIAFDKTGTLTLGDLVYEGIEALDDNSPVNEQQAFAVAYALERNAVHPIAKAILAHHQENSLQEPLISLHNFKSIPGYGLEATATLQSGDTAVYIGNTDYVIDKLPQKKSERLLSKVQAIADQGALTAILLIGNEPFIFRFKEALRPKMAEMIRAIKERGWKTVMLTGDRESSAKKIAKEVGIDVWYAELKPENKLEHVAALSKTENLAMVGDGVNDAPALAQATVGICMGKVGSSSAIEAADVVLLHDNIELLNWLIDKAYQTQAVVKQNVSLAAVAILVASIPALAGLLPLWLAVVIHEGGTILVGLNALRLLRK